MSAQVEVCRRCGRQIVWRETFRGARVPLDCPPERRYVPDDEGKMMPVDTWLPHFATCPQELDLRGKKP